jgi:hypothetical protein
MIDIDWVNGNAEQRVVLKLPIQRGIPEDAHRAPPRCANAPAKGLRLDNPPQPQVDHRSKAGRVLASEIAERMLCLGAEQPRGRNESARINADLAELAVCSINEFPGPGAIHVIKFALVIRVNASGETLHDTLFVAPRPPMEVPMRYDLVTLAGEIPEPIAKRSIAPNMAATVMIGDDQEGNPRHAQRSEIRHNARTRRVGQRRNIVQRYYERAGHKNCGLAFADFGLIVDRSADGKRGVAGSRAETSSQRPVTAAMPSKLCIKANPRSPIRNSQSVKTVCPKGASTLPFVFLTHEST